jgi:GalNAc-alpha-(1->4)-GalNAc-alpha-(1->3)-diNAcBac-PP-undecaprenol alpha-1,4-N-acetyl-D-galactosaminyltransferase
MIVAPSFSMGGMQSASITLANELVTLKYCNVILCSIIQKEHFYTINEDIKVVEPINFNLNSISLLKTILYLRATIRRYNPESILVFGKFYGSISLLSAIGLKKRVFITERSSPYYKWPLMQRLFNRLVYSLILPTGVISQTSIAKEVQQSYYGNKTPIRVVPNAIKRVKRYQNISRKKIILAVGRLNDSCKGFDRLIDAYNLVNDKTWLLYIVGGENDIILEKKIKYYQLSHRVFLKDKSQQIDEWYAKAGIFVIPSRSEGYPNALCEAMLAGLPCISFNFVAGPNDIIQHDHDGLLVEDGNIKLLANQIDYLISNKEIRDRLGQNAINSTKILNSEEVCELITSTVFDE